MRALITTTTTAAILVAAACGSEDVSVPSETATAEAGGGDDGGPGPGFDLDGSAKSDTSTSGCGDVLSDPKNCGVCGKICDAGQVCVKGACACPPYQSLCAGKCIPTVDDANNCGGCGKTCTGALACSAGECAATCLPGLDICANRCVDLQSANDHCGTCGNACPPGQGCVAGSCAAAVPVGPAPAKCAGGSGPPIINAPSAGGCLGGLAATTFRWSLCSCKDVGFSAPLLTDAYDSTKGPYKPGGMGGGVGANLDHSASQVAEVWGDLWAHGTKGLQTSQLHTIKHDLRLNGKLQSSAPVVVDDDAWVNGNVTTSSTITIGNTLRVPAGATVAPAVTAKSVVSGPVTFPAPCDCDASQLVPIAAIVQAHQAPNNDNATIGLDPAVLSTPAAPTRLDLPCGQYYLTTITGSKPITIAAHGRTALYIEGDLQTSADITFVVDPIGELDVFITGKLGTSAELRVGSPNYPALSRTYVGSTTGVGLSAKARVAGNLYVGYGLVTWSAPADLYGALFAGDFQASAATRIHYDRAVLGAGSACPPPGGTGSADGGAGDGGGAGPGDCGSCRDCNNQACVAGKCGACASSADCCAPLVCVGGTCLPAVK